MAQEKPAAPEPVTTPKSEITAPTESTVQTAPTPHKKTPWFRLTIMILFGIIYAWDLFAALSNFFGKLDQVSQINKVRELNGFPLIDTPWVPLVANLLLPIVVFGLALWISRRRSVGILAVMLLAGLGVVAAVSLSIIANVLATS